MEAEDSKQPLLSRGGVHEEGEEEETQMDTLPSYDMIDQLLLNTKVQIINDYRPLAYDEHNYQTEKEEPGDTNFVWTVFNLWNDVLGAGMVTVPLYVAAMSPVVIPFAFVFFGWVTVYTLNTVYYLSKKYRKSSYPELCQYSLGYPGYIIVCILIFIFNFGGFVGGLQIIGTNVPNLLRWIHGSDSIWFDRKWVLLFSCIGFLPLSFFTRISSYTINSFLSTISLFILSFVLLFQAVLHHNEYPAPPNPYEIHFDANFVSALGGMSYLFVCHDLSFSVFKDFRNPTKKRWHGVATVTIVLTIVIFCITGYSGYFMFYYQVQDNILDNFGYNSIPANIGRIFISLNILISVPYYCFMPRLALYAILSLFTGQIKRKQLFNAIMTVFVLGLALLIAELVEDLGATFELVGGIAAISIAFILPPVIFLKLEHGPAYSPKKLMHICILVYGIISMVASTGSTLYGM